MVASIRDTDIINPLGVGGQLLPFGSPRLLCNKGQDYCLEAISYFFTNANEIGTGAGQTQDTTSNPTSGFLFAQFQGASIQQIVGVNVRKDKIGANGGTVFRSNAWAAAGPHFYNIAFRIVNPTDVGAPGYNPNYASLYMLDTGSDAATRIAIGDTVIILIQTGNSVATQAGA